MLVDLRDPASGTIPITMRIAGARIGQPLALSTFMQPEALRLTSVTARQGPKELGVRRALDTRGFERFEIAAPTSESDVEVRYAVRPGAAEEVRMAGPTGYRFGYVDGTFALLGGRQVFLLPMEPAAPRRIAIAFRLPARWRLAAPWPTKGASHRPTATLTGGNASARAVEATIGAGELDTQTLGSLRVHAVRAIPDTLRQRAIRMGLEVEGQLAGLLGRRRRPFDLVLAPPAPDGMLISVPPGATSLGQSLGEGVPTRWLSITRALGEARLGERIGERIVPGRMRWVVEGLPLYLATGISERNGWRSRQAWMEQFYYEAAGLELELGKPGDLGEAPDPLLREWRAALALDRLDHALRSAGKQGLEDRLRAASRGSLDPADVAERDLPDPTRAELTGWLGAERYALPFPSAESAPIPLALPAPTAAAPPGSSRLDLYVGGRNLGLLEQCGCRGEQAGGLARRATILQSRLRSGPPALAIELGDAVPFDQNTMPLDRQKEVESDLVFELMAASGEGASTISHAELSYGPRFLQERLARLPRGFHLLSANVRVPGVTPVLEERRSGWNIRITGAEDPSAYHLGRALEFEDATARIPIDPAPEAVAQALGPPAPGTLFVVAGSLSPSTVLALHRVRPDLSLIVTDDYFRFAQDPRLAWERPLGDSLATLGRLDRTLVVVLRTDTYALAHVSLALDPAALVTAAQVEALVLDEGIPDHVRVRRRLDDHYAKMAAEAGLTEPPPLGILREQLGGSYVGGSKCVSCHEKENRQWESTAHASAFATLLDRRRQGVPGCVRCHVTGYRQPGGYRMLAQNAVRHVQCESCHGPGSRHLDDPAANNIVRDPAAAVCVECHDPEHSEMTTANFQEYRAKVVHGGPASPGASRRLISQH